MSSTTLARLFMGLALRTTMAFASSTLRIFTELHDMYVGLAGYFSLRGRPIAPIQPSDHDKRGELQVNQIERQQLTVHGALEVM